MNLALFFIHLDMTSAQPNAREKGVRHAPAVPLWAKRLSTAFEVAGITNKKGALDKTALGKIFNVSYKTIESWTTGRTQPSFKKLIQVREVTGFSLDWILSDDAATKMPLNPRSSNEFDFLKIEKKITTTG